MVSFVAPSWRSSFRLSLPIGSNLCSNVDWDTGVDSSTDSDISLDTGFGIGGYAKADVA
ncbi:hypothetical protein RG959_21150 [Domibacillus sp. 8LH]|uniref:hypothetical protein n=1 Tax=Domibacillus sp. 8LH TaxID=3073900 RepID=UPI003180C87D